MKFLTILIILFINSCSLFHFNFSKEEDENIRSIVDKITISIPYKENYHRIFANSFYDMTGNQSRTSHIGNLSANVDIVFQKVISGTSTSGVIMQYMKNGTLNYTLNLSNNKKIINIQHLESVKEVKKISTPVKNKTDKIQKTKDNMKNDILLYTGVIKSSSQYSGSPVDLFAEYTAELNAEENLARQLARELYYNLIITVRLHLLKCRKIKETLDAKKYFVFANDKSEDEEENKTLDNIDLKDIKKIDYKIYENACTFI